MQAKNVGNSIVKEIAIADKIIGCIEFFQQRRIESADVHTTTGTDVVVGV
jgi:hypothetical protein